MKKIFSYVAVFAMIANLFGCSSSTMVSVNDPEAKIYVDGEFKGKGNITHTDTKIVGSTTNVTVKKDGCEPMNYSFSRSEELDVGACAGGVFVMFPFLWVMKYKPVHTFEFECNKK